MAVISDREIRNKLLESDDPKGWKYSIGEQMRDNLTNEQAAMLAYFFYVGDRMGLGHYFIEVMGPAIEKTMASEIERYKDTHDITVGRDDLSAYKEHRDLTEE